MTWPSWSELATVLQALADVAWPAVIVFLILRFHKDVRALVTGLKLRRGKILGQEFELENLNRLEAETRTLQPPNDILAFTGGRREPPADALQQILRASPKAALMFLQAEIERQLRLVLKKRGIPDDLPHLNAMNLFRDAEEVPKDFTRWLTEFRKVRNQIIHGRDATDDDALRAIDIGLRILSVLERIDSTEMGG